MKNLLLVLALIAQCAPAEQWVIDGQKKITVYNPAGLRSQIGAVATSSGQSTNLTVYDTMTVAGIVDSTSAIISGSDAGDYAGTYAYAGTDSYYGAYFTNTLGRFLFSDVDYWLNGEWALGLALGSVVFGNAGNDWYEMSGWSQVDFIMDGTPSYGITRGNVVAAGTVSATGKLSGNELSLTDGDFSFAVSPAEKSSVLSVGPDITFDDPGTYSVLRNISLFNENWGSIDATPVWGSQLTALVRYGGSLNFGNTYFSSGLFFANAGGATTTFSTNSSCNKLVGSFGASNGGDLFCEQLRGFVGAIDADGGKACTISNVYNGVGLLEARTGNTTVGNVTNLLVAGDNLTIQNVRNVGGVGDGMTFFRSDTFYAGSFAAMSGSGSSSTENRYYFGSNSWIFVSGTNLMFKNSAGLTGTVNVTY